MTTTNLSEPRGRKRSFDIDAAVDTATKLFLARGYDAVGVAELVSVLGIKPPSFYAAFGSKAGLFGRALQRYAATDANLLVAAQVQGGDVAAVITRVFALAAERYPACNGMAGCLVLDGARNSADAEAQALARAAQAAGREALRAHIATAAPDSSAHDDAGRLADFVAIALAGMSAAARDGAEGAVLRAFADMAARAFCHELAAWQRR